MYLNPKTYKQTARMTIDFLKELLEEGQFDSESVEDLTELVYDAFMDATEKG